jgi:hypothetical protein
MHNFTWITVAAVIYINCELAGGGKWEFYRTKEMVP